MNKKMMKLLLPISRKKVIWMSGLDGAKSKETRYSPVTVRFDWLIQLYSVAYSNCFQDKECIVV